MKEFTPKYIPINEVPDSTYWQCPQCGITVKNDVWRREKPERTICQNQHTPKQMVLKHLFENSFQFIKKQEGSK